MILICMTYKYSIQFPDAQGQKTIFHHILSHRTLGRRTSIQETGLITASHQKAVSLPHIKGSYHQPSVRLFFPFIKKACG